MSFLDTLPAPIDAFAGLDPLAEFRVDSPREVAALLRELNDTGAAVRLSAPGGAGQGNGLGALAATAHHAQVPDGGAAAAAHLCMLL